MKSSKKILKVVLLTVYIILVILYWYKASRWESLLSEQWAEDPAVSNLSALLEYFKAFFSIVVSGAILLSFWFLLGGNSAKQDQESSDRLSKIMKSFSGLSLFLKISIFIIAILVLLNIFIVVFIYTNFFEFIIYGPQIFYYKLIGINV